MRLNNGNIPLRVKRLVLSALGHNLSFRCTYRTGAPARSDLAAPPATVGAYVATTWAGSDAGLATVSEYISTTRCTARAVFPTLDTQSGDNRIEVRTIAVL